MNPDTLDRDPGLERLLRATFDAQAAQVTGGPAWPVDRRPRRSVHWLTVAASVITVLALAGGFAFWSARDDGSSQAGGNAPLARRVALPAAWQRAVHTAPLRVAGSTVTPSAMTPSGTTIVSWSVSSGTGVGAVSPAGATRWLYTVVDPSLLAGVDADDRRMVLTTLPDANRHAPASTPRRVVVVDLRSGRVTNLARPGVMPAGYVVNDSVATLQDGVVYWAAVPTGQTDDHTTSHTPGVIVSYDLASGAHHVVGRGTYLTSNEADPRGVFWPGGGRPATGVPAGVPALTTRLNHYRNAVHNGTAWAWDGTADGRLVGWTDGTTTRTWRQSIAAQAHSDLTTVVAVDGPFVFVVPMNGSNGHLFVLDSRTGAYADTGIDGFPIFAAGHRVAVVTRANDHAPYVTVLFDATRLPGLSR